MAGGCPQVGKVQAGALGGSRARAQGCLDLSVQGCGGCASAFLRKAGMFSCPTGRLQPFLSAKG